MAPLFCSFKSLSYCLPLLAHHRCHDYYLEILRCIQVMLRLGCNRPNLRQVLTRLSLYQRSDNRHEPAGCCLPQQKLPRY